MRDEPGALARQRTYLGALGAHCGVVEIILGRYQTKTMVCRQCGNVWTSYEEKETDVNIAVSFVADAAAAASDIALIISADSDLCPAIRTARFLNPGRAKIAAFPPRRARLSSARSFQVLLRSLPRICATRFFLRSSVMEPPAESTSAPASGADSVPGCHEEPLRLLPGPRHGRVLPGGRRQGERLSVKRAGAG